MANQLLTLIIISFQILIAKIMLFITNKNSIFTFSYLSAARKAMRTKQQATHLTTCPDETVLDGRLASTPEGK